MNPASNNTGQRAVVGGALNPFENTFPGHSGTINRVAVGSFERTASHSHPHQPGQRAVVGGALQQEQSMRVEHHAFGILGGHQPEQRAVVGGALPPAYNPQHTGAFGGSHVGQRAVVGGALPQNTQLPGAPRLPGQPSQGASHLPGQPNIGPRFN